MKLKDQVADSFFFPPLAHPSIHDRDILARLAAVRHRPHSRLAWL